MLKFKKISLLVGLFMVFISANSFAQVENRVGSKSDVKSGFDKGEVSLVRNPKVYTTNPVFNGVEVDKRVMKYYVESDLVGMDAKKLKQLNVIYLKSFEVVKYSELSEKCKKFIDEKFDIGEYEKYRKPDQNTVINIQKEGFTFQVSLYSRNELSTLLQK